MEDETLPSEKFAKEISGLFWIFLAAFLFISMYSFNPGDPTFNQAVSSSWKIKNLIGPAGSYAAGLLVDMVGIGAWLIPFYFLHLGLSSFIAVLKQPWWRWTGLTLLYACLLSWASHPWFTSYQTDLSIHEGGFIGALLSKWSFHYLKPVGAFLFWLFTTLAGIQLTLNLSWASIAKRFRSILVDLGLKNKERFDRRLKRIKAERDLKKAEEKAEVTSDPVDLGKPAKKNKPKKHVKDEEDDLEIVLQPFNGAIPKKKSKPKAKPLDTTAEFPSLDMLAVPKVTGITVDPKVLEAKTESLAVCLKDFNIDGEIQNVIPGPVVTMFEFRPAPGVKVSKIAGLTDDIALALKAISVRIEAPIPGKDSVGVEIPNDQRQIVYLREIFEADCFKNATSPMTMALGKDIQGEPVVADLIKMPHLLVAGATGAGKSVCLNGLLMSLLYRARPDEVKLLLIDPKRIELAVYASLPHLVHPVVTDMALAKSALEWAVYEMDQRYQKMARLGVRNIASFNEKLLKIQGDDMPEDLADLEHMPYLVIVVDELADLMLTAGKEVEISIVRLAQLARAAGIHIILATQRPSVDVVTGLIKANFPTRISFQVTSKHDSRTILDMGGAEKLLGRGDMLFKPSGAQLRRLHGALVDDDEIKLVVDFWKKKFPQDFDLDFSDWKDTPSGPGKGSMPSESDDPVYGEAVEFVLSQGKASISLLQRRFRIGFNRSARFIEQMEQDGILGPQDGSKPRIVLVTKD